MMRFGLGMLLVPFLSSCSPEAADKPKGVATAPADDACTVAVRFVDSWLKQRGGGRPVVFADTPNSLPNDPAPGPWFKLSGEYGEAPSSAMLDRGPQMPRDSAVARCPSLRAYLDHAHIRHGAQAVADTASDPDGDNIYAADILALTLPSLSPDGTQALTMTSSQTGPLSGQGQFFLLKRQTDAGWPAVSTQNFSIS